MDTTADIFKKIVVRIITEQGNIIGDLAWNEAGKVDGLSIVNRATGEVSFAGDPKNSIDGLINRYEKLFGKLSREVCREAVLDLVADIPAGDVPTSLK